MEKPHPAAREEPGAARVLGPLEHEVMRSLWDEGDAPVPQVLDRINAARSEEHQLAYTTVMTVLVRLAEKGLLDREKRGRAFHYSPRFDEPDLMRHLGEEEVVRLLDRYGDSVLVHFAAALDNADPALLARVVELAEHDG